MLMEQLKALQQGFNEEKEKAYKDAKATQVLQTQPKQQKQQKHQQKNQLAYTQIALK